MIVVYPGTFDPITLGHIDIIKRASKLCDQLIVAVSHSDVKTPLFTIDERTDLVKRCTNNLPNVIVESYEGLTIDLLMKKQAHVLVRGVRNIIDCEFELTLQGMYKGLMPQLEIMLLPANSHVSYISSTLVRDVIMHHGDPSPFVPLEVAQYIKEKLNLKL